MSLTNGRYARITGIFMAKTEYKFRSSMQITTTTTHVHKCCYHLPATHIEAYNPHNYYAQKKIHTNTKAWITTHVPTTTLLTSSVTERLTFVPSSPEAANRGTPM